MPNMKVIVISENGSPDVLQYESRPLPVPGAADVLVKVKAASVNGLDLMLRRGSYPGMSGVGDIPGLDIAGEVVACGTQVKSLKDGDAVCALVPGGGYGEYCVAPAAHCLPIPDGFDFLQAASLPEVYFTAWVNLCRDVTLPSGATVLIHGGAGGVGMAAIHIAKQAGWTVFATAGTEKKRELCEQLGATRAINYNTSDFVAIIKEETRGAGVDLVLDVVGIKYLERNLDVLSTGGRLVVIATPGGSQGQINLGPMLGRRLSVSGSSLRPRSAIEKEQITLDLKSIIWPQMASGKILPIIDRVFALHEAAEAHRFMESGDHLGKIVLHT